MFAQLAALSAQRSELAQKLISTQESTLRHISRELHDEFGQILTAVGAMLSRAGNQVPEGSPLRAELREVAEIAQTTLDKVRSLSQALHPVMLDETGLESTLDWYLPVLERQAGIHISYEKSGTAYPVDGNAAIHVYRVVQEALNNVTRHSGAGEAWVRLRYLPKSLELEVEDHGSGFVTQSAKQGIGLVAMRERAELLGGTIEFSRPMPSGTLVRLTVPREKMGEKSGEQSGVACRIKFLSCWWMTTAWCAADSAAFLKMSRTSRSRVKPAMARKPFASPKSFKPNVVVMDCAMPNMNGLQATRKILEQQPGTLVLMLSMHPEETLVRQALDAGARGYVLKNAVDLELGAAIRKVVAGETVLDSQLNRPASLKGDRDEHLTPRELEILQMIVEGKSNKEIATALELSANTVAVHRANIMDALGIHKTAELVVYAIRNGLVNLP